MMTSKGIGVAALLAAAGVAWFAGDAVAFADERAKTLVIEKADRDFGETPVCVAIEPGRLPEGHWRLVDPARSRSVPAQTYRDGEQLFLAFVLDRTPTDTSASFEIQPETDPDRQAGGIHLVADGPRIKVDQGGQPWTVYVPDDGPKPYFDPLRGPNGAVLTRNWPMRDVPGEPHDHPHHRSLWFAHFDVNKVDTWDENPGHGQIRESGRPVVVGDGGPIGVLRTRNDWLDRAGKKVCEDERLVRFYALRAMRIFDFEVTLKATQGPVKVGDNKDGVFGIRVAAPMAVTARQGGQILNSRGVKDKAAWGQPAEWVDYTGPVADGTMGVAILNDPTSFRFPTTWHVRDYGLFAANPFGWHDFGQAQSGEHAIEPGGSIRLAYRVILHAGTTAEADIATRFAAYARPPRVTLQ